MVNCGMSYAAASLTCSIAPFLALVGAAAVAVAIARGGLISGIRRGGQWVPRVSGLLLLVVGAYVSWYGAWELRVLDGGDPSDPVIELAARVQATLAEWVRAITP